MNNQFIPFVLFLGKENRLVDSRVDGLKVGYLKGNRPTAPLPSLVVSSQRSSCYDPTNWKAMQCLPLEFESA